MSAIRSGWQPIAVDLFCDDDLLRRCRCIKLSSDDYPWKLSEIVNRLHPALLFYVGGMENFPDVIDSIAPPHTLIGNRGDVLRAVRDPWQLADAFQNYHIRCPAVCERGATPSSGEWLMKPIRSAGGRGIHDYRGGELNVDRFYLQKKIVGRHASALYIGTNCHAKLIGITYQLIGEDWLNSADYAYCGSIGPVPIDGNEDVLCRIGQCLSKRFGLVGLFGVDFVINNEGVWPVEVNPRYTASAELFERSIGGMLMRDHVQACQASLLPDYGFRSVHCLHGKAILYAPCDVSVSAKFVQLMDQQNANGEYPRTADIPRSNSKIRAGNPILSVFASGEDEASVLAGLKKRSRQIYDLLNAQPFNVHRAV